MILNKNINLRRRLWKQAKKQKSMILLCNKKTYIKQKFIKI